MKFDGEFDTYEVTCERCESDLDGEHVSEGIYSGIRVHCGSCGAEALVYDDGGVYRLADSDESISLSVV